MTPAERSLHSRANNHDTWARTPPALRTVRTAPAREAVLKKFEQQADPDNTMAPEERRRRAISLRKAHMQRLAIKSVQARRARKEAQAKDSGVETPGQIT